MICSPLAASDCLPPISGVWVCENRFNHAINLRNASHQLLTLHRYGQGISPMGWLIRRADFDQLAHFGTRNPPDSHERWFAYSLFSITQTTAYALFTHVRYATDSAAASWAISGAL